MAYDDKDNIYYGYIYKITNTINGYIYIGQTAQDDAYKRFSQHIIESRKNNPSIIVDKAIAKYGKENFTFEVLYKITNPSEKEMKKALDESEINTISLLESHISYGHGYNVSLGGSSFLQSIIECFDVYDLFDRILLDENVSASYIAQKYDLSEATVYNVSKGETPNYHNKYVFRRHGESIDKYSTESLLHKTLYKFDPNSGEIIEKYNSLNDAVIQNGWQITQIDDDYHLCHGFWWSYNTVFRYNGVPQKHHRIDLYLADGTYVSSFNSVYECAKKMSLDAPAIQSMCDGTKRKTCKGYVTRYAGDPFDKYNIKPERGSKGKTVYQFSLDGKLIKVHESVTSAIKNVGKYFANNIIGNPKRTAAGYWWNYKNEFNYQKVI